jgi:TPR repeat protein
MNAIHMGLWAVLFIAMLASGLIEAPHPGDSVPFWKKALAENKPFAGHSLVMIAGSHAKNRKDGDAANEIGLILMQGTVKEVNQNPAKAAEYFAMASELGSLNGSYNVAMQALFQPSVPQRIESVVRAFTQLEQAAADGKAHWKTFYVLAYAYETGKGYAVDPAKAAALYAKCGPGNVFAAKGLSRLAIVHGVAVEGIEDVVRTLDAACRSGDAEACWCLAYLHLAGKGGGPADPARARALVETACGFKSEQACAALTPSGLAPYANYRRIGVPGWSSKYGIE